MGMSAAEQKRHATVRDELLRVEEVCGELVKALSEDVEALGERVTTELREEREARVSAGYTLRRELEVLVGDVMKRLREEAAEEGRQESSLREEADRELWAALRGFRDRGFWGRVGWLVRGR